MEVPLVKRANGAVKAVLASFIVTTLAGCSTTTGSVVLGATGVAGLLGITPGSEIEQIYYLGVFDPLEKIPQSFYRVTVRGQASALPGEKTKFASGWVPAQLMDGLGSSLDAKLAGGDISPTGAPLDVPELLDPVKRMFMIGPEGVRIAPSKHRLVIVMGSSPQNFFKAVDESLGEIAQVEIDQADSETARAISEEHLRLHKETAAIQALRLRLAEDEIDRGKAEQP